MDTSPNIGSKGDSLDLKSLSTAEIADLHERHSTEIGNVALRIQTFNAMVGNTENRSVTPRIANAMRQGLTAERSKALEFASVIDRALPRKRITDTIKSLERKLEQLDLQELALLGISQEPTEWLTVYRGFGENAPGDTYDIMANDLQARFDRLQQQRNTLTARVMAYSAIFNEWPIVPEPIPNQSPSYIETEQGTVKMLKKTIMTQKPRSNSEVNDHERHTIQQNVSERIIALLKASEDTFFTYQEIADAVYDNKDRPVGKRDNRIGTTFNNNLRNPNQENIFARLLGNKWVLIKGSRIPIDPDTGEPPLKYKPLVCYKVKRHQESEQ